MIRKHLLKVFLSLSCLFFAACERDEPPSEIIYAKRLNPYHIVKEGETVADVANKYNMKEKDLIRINRLKSPFTLIAGQRLLVHVKDTDELNTPQESSDDELSVRPLEETPPQDNMGTELGQSPNAPDTSIPSTDTIPSPPAGLSEGSTLETVKDSTVAKTAAISHNYEWPVKGDVIQTFGQKLPDGSLSDGINIKAAANLPVKAAGDGIVKSAGSQIPAYGNMVVITHPDGKVTVYAHLKEISVQASGKGAAATVKKGQVIGRVGKTGIVKEPQLYFQVRERIGKNLVPIDPTKVLS